MLEPKASHPYWPDALEKPSDATSGLKPWSWALERLEQSHNYWVATSRPDRRPHLIVILGLWWQDAFWVSTGPRTREAKNNPSLSPLLIGTPKPVQAAILHGTHDQRT